MMELYGNQIGYLVNHRKCSGLVSKTLGFARVYSDGQLERTERGLEEELRRESCVPPTSSKLARCRRQGELILHSKHVLMLIVILNLVDCALVMGELILDIHYIRERRAETEMTSQHFIDEMEVRYPNHLHGHDIDAMSRLYDQIYNGYIYWPGDNIDNLIRFAENMTSYTRPRNLTSGSTGQAVNNKSAQAGYTVIRNVNVTTNSVSDGLWVGRNVSTGNPDVYGYQKRQFWMILAHAMHKTSITILGILFVENIIKLICMGRSFFIKKLEVFDSVIVVVSFVVDLVLLKGLTQFSVQEALFILSFLLPWRVIRVVNSLIVAVLDHEHFQLKMLYKEKKIVTAQLKDLRDQEKRWDFHLQKIESFCESEGIPKWKIRQHTAMGRKQSTITSMASLALTGFIQGMVTSQSDKDLFDKTLERSFALNQMHSDVNKNKTQHNAHAHPHTVTTNLDVISETDDDDDEVRHSLTKQHSATESYIDDSSDDDTRLKDDSGHKTAEKRSSMTQASNGTLKVGDQVKRVSFDQREHKPLLRQDSVDINDQQNC